jgi:hypothetical protein
VGDFVHHLIQENWAVAGLLALCSVITAGVVLAVFVMWLVPVPPTERYARRVLAEELQLRQNSPNASGRQYKR